MRKILYHHIPKTGGQSLALRLASAFALGRSSYMAGDLNLSAFLWARRLNSALSARLRESLAKQDSKLVHR